MRMADDKMWRVVTPRTGNMTEFPQHQFRLYHAEFWNALDWLKGEAQDVPWWCEPSLPWFQ